MYKIVNKINKVAKKSLDIIKHEGAVRFAKKGMRFIYYRQFPNRKTEHYKDILFINGCTLPHPTRYRVDHQVEQILAGGLTVDSIFYDRLTLDKLKYYRGFVFFRCPITDVVKEFIKTAKEFNKVCFFDIDDLVIDNKYTDTIEYLKTMSKEDKLLYDDGVNRMRETLKLCDYGITTTDTLKEELSGYIKEVYINRNVASDEMVGRSLEALRYVQKDESKIVIGYFSGSITHNEDFELVLPSLVKLLKKYKNLNLRIAGILDIPEQLEEYKEQIETIGFMDWRKMPISMVTCDINLAPLTNTIFNEAKSENKWIEAALVKVVTVASNIGAFKSAIKDGLNGVLVDDDWYGCLEKIILDKNKRQYLANNAYDEVLANHTTINTSYGITSLIRSKLARNIAFILPSTDISGGVNVVLKHAEILKKNGWDVTLIDNIDKDTLKKSRVGYNYRLAIPGNNVVIRHKTHMESYFNTIVATLWSTVSDIKSYANVTNRLYFVQNLETDFYVWGGGWLRLFANASYGDVSGVRYITMSLWCKKWLKDRFGKDAAYASNGIDLRYFEYKKRDFNKNKIKILIEGDSKSEYKNTDEAFRIVDKLDPKKYEISYLSYRKEPKDWYRVDHFYNRIPLEEVGKVYSKCDILIKTSLLESFSYPPLEMMATGGVSVVVPNDGNVEYLRDGENCLFYKQGDIDDGVNKIEQFVNNKTLRNKIIKGGLQTAKRYEWTYIEKDILSLYE